MPPPASQPEAETPGPAAPRWGWWAVAGLALVLYTLTASRTIQWQDYGHFVLRIVIGELFNELGLALAHPLHFWLGQGAVAILPVEPPYAVALVSALAGAVTVANVFGVVRLVTGKPGAAIIAAGSLMVANTFWRMSTMPECYTVTTALLSAELWCMAIFFKRRSPGNAAPHTALAPLMGMMFLSGLGLANHNMALLTLPVSGLVLVSACRRGDVRPGGFALALAAWFVGAAPYLALVVIEAVSLGDPKTAVVSALFGSHYADNVLNANPGVKQAAISVAFTVLSFPGLALPLAAAGLCAGRRFLRDRLDGDGLWWAWVGALALHLLFVLRYNVVDQHTFLLPTYTLVALFVGVGYAWLAGRLSRSGLRIALPVAVSLGVLMAPGVYVVAAKAARDRGALGSMARHKPYRDDYRYLFVPWGVGETSAQRMSREAVTLAGDRGVVVVEDAMAGFAVAYERSAEGKHGVALHLMGPDGEPDWSAWRGRAVVLVPARTTQPPIAPPPGYTWRAAAELYVLVADSGGGGDDAPPGPDNPATP